MKDTQQEEKQPDCAGHKKDLFGETDMKVVAEAIGDLHYETLSDLLYYLSDKLFVDGKKDFDNGRTQLSQELFGAQMAIHRAHKHIGQAFKQCKPFMKNNQQ